MYLLITFLVLWILWKLFKFSLWLLWIMILLALAAFFVKVLIIPALVLIGGGLAWAIAGRN